MARLYALLCAIFCTFVCFGVLAAPPASASAPADKPAASAPAAAASSSAAAAAKGEVKVRDKVVIVLRASRGDKPAAERARAANQTIETLLEHPDDIEDVRLDESLPGAAVIFFGKTPVLTLGEEDAAASGEPSLHVLGANTAQRFEEAVKNEQKRSRIAQTVFSLSLVVFSGLIAFLVIGRVGEVAARVRAWLTEHPDRLSGLKVGNIEVLGVAAVRGAISVAVMLLHRLTQVAIAYGWLIFGLSLFDSTRGYTEKLGGLVLAPISALVSRVGGALPMLVIVLVAGAVVFVLIRFVGLFMESVGRGETRIGWVPTDFAKPISLLLRVAIVVVSLLVATPLITGSDEGALSRAGLAALFAVGLAATPVIASAAAGSVVVFGRKLRRGEYVELGPRAGRVIAVSLLEVRLLEREGSELRVPHLMALWQPTRVIGKLPLTSVEIEVRSTPDQEVRRVIEEQVRALGGKVRIQLLSLDESKSRYRITAEEPSSGALEQAVRRAVMRVTEGAFTSPPTLVIHPAPTPSIPPPSVMSPEPPPASKTPSIPPPANIPPVGPVITEKNADDKPKDRS